MASDLSTLIQDGLCSTLTALLSKDAKLKETTRVHEKDLLDIQTLKIDSTFEFANITSTWSFIIPAYSASYIFNAMLGDTSDPVDVLDDDIADAISEFISNVSGGLTTMINGSDLEDLGTVKFTIGDKDIIEKNQLDDTENMFKLLIDLDGVDIIIFVIFDKVIIPFIESINSSEMTFYPDENMLEEIEVDDKEIENQEPKNEENTENIENEAEKTTKSDNEEPKLENDSNKKDEEKDTDEEEIELTEEEQKAKKLKKLIIIIGGLIGITILSGVVMYFLGMFDPEPIVVKDTNTTKVVKNKDGLDIVKYKNKNTIKFSPSMINLKRLNARLEDLTKYEILTDEEIKKQKIEQEKLMANIKKEQMLIEFSKLNKEEQIVPKNIKEESNTTTEIKTKSKESEKVVKIDNKLKFLLVHSLKYKLFKELILKTNTKQARISICKNRDGRTAIYIGPFENRDLQTHMTKLIQDKQSDLQIDIADITQDEFNKRCDF